MPVAAKTDRPRRRVSPHQPRRRARICGSGTAEDGAISQSAPGQQGVRRTLLGITSILMTVVAAYLTFAAGVLFLLALTDISGFVTDTAAVLSFLVLLTSGLAASFVGVRALRLWRGGHDGTGE